MFWSKIISVAAVITFVFGIATIDCAVAGEKQKWHAASYTVKWEQIEIGDEEGHVIAIYEQKQIYFNENTGEKTPSTTFGILDLNIKISKLGKDLAAGMELIFSKMELKRLELGKASQSEKATGGGHIPS